MPHHAELPLWDSKSSEQKIEAMRQMIDYLYVTALTPQRNNLRQILQNAIPFDDKERADIAQMLDMLEKYPNLMASNCEVGHFTGSALVCDNQGRALLHYHKKLNKWLQFGGHADYETNFADVALRETLEETGLSDLRFYPNPENPLPIDFDIHTIPESKNRPEHLHLDLRYMLITSSPDNLHPQDRESNEFMWICYQNLINPTDPSDADLIDPALKRLIQKCEDRYNHPKKYYNQPK